MTLITEKYIKTVEKAKFVGFMYSLVNSLEDIMHEELERGYVAEVGSELSTKERTRVGLGSREGIPGNTKIDIRCHLYEHLLSIFLNPFTHSFITID